MEPQSSPSPGRTERWIAIALCAAVVVAAALGQMIATRPDSAARFAPYWLPLAATLLAAAGLVRSNGRPPWIRVQSALLWGGLLLMVWAANGLLFDWLRAVRLIRLTVDWSGLATRTLAFAASLLLAHLALARPAGSPSTRHATWYGFAAFVLAMPYPVLRVVWAMGGTVGIDWPGAAGKGWAPVIIAIPWLMAAVLSLLLIPARSWMPRRLLLIAGWTATAIVCSIGPVAVWTIAVALIKHADLGIHGIRPWIFVLFYGSWFLWGIAAGAATRSYQLRSASLTESAQKSEASAELVSR